MLKSLPFIKPYFTKTVYHKTRNYTLYITTVHEQKTKACIYKHTQTRVQTQAKNTQGGNTHKGVNIY